jgi:membrane protease YdiL (CAAX protease family)
LPVTSSEQHHAHPVGFALGAAIVGYWLIYVAYLFIHLEGEITHWVSLVIIPSVSLAYALGRPQRTFAWMAVWRIVGFRRSGFVRALACGGAVGGAMTVLQLFGRQSHSARMLFGSAAGFGWLAAGFLLMSATAAATEEFFFRGVVQGFLSQSRLRSWAAGAVSTVLFVAYHVPYAYESPHWESHGSMTAAMTAAAADAFLVGALLSAAYIASRRHIFSPWVAHALTNMIPGALYLQQHLGTGV